MRPLDVLVFAVLLTTIAICIGLEVRWASGRAEEEATLEAIRDVEATLDVAGDPPRLPRPSPEPTAHEQQEAPPIIHEIIHVDAEGRLLEGSKRFRRYSTSGDLLWEGDEPENVFALYREPVEVEDYPTFARLEALAERWIGDADLRIQPGLEEFASDEEQRRAARYDRRVLVDGAVLVGAVVEVDPTRELTHEERSLVDEVVTLFALESRVFDLRCKVSPGSTTNIDDLRPVADVQEVRRELQTILKQAGVSLQLEAAGGITEETRRLLEGRASQRR